MPQGTELSRAAVLELALEQIASFARDPKLLDRFLDRYAPNDEVRRVVRTAVQTTLKLREGRRGP